MASWFTTSAEEFRKQISIAATSAQKLAEQTDEAWKDGLDRAATSAQRLATQTDEGLQSLRGSLLDSASRSLAEALPLRRSSFGGAGEASAEELVRRFEEEAGTLRSVCPAAAAEGAAAGPAVAAAALRAWEERLAADAEDSGRRLTAPALRGFVRSQAPKVALEALTAASWRQQAFRRAAELAGAVQAPLSEAVPAGEAGPVEAVGDFLGQLLAWASSAPPKLLAELLGLLAAAVEAADGCRVGTLAADGVAAEEEVRWVVSIILATLPDSREADVLAALRLYRAAEQVLAAANALGAPAASAASGAPLKGPVVTKLPTGSEVWACWPGDGCWYRAHVRGYSSKSERVQVTWLRSSSRLAGPCASDEYISAVNAEETALTELSTSAVMLVNATIRRPPPAPSEGLPEALWEKKLNVIEAHGVHVRELHLLGRQLECHRQWEEQQDVGTMSTADGKLCRSSSQGEAAEADGAAAVASPALPLSGAAETLLAFRTEAEERAEALGSVAAEYAEEAVRFQEQIKTSTSAMASELKVLQAERAAMTTRIEGLRFRREELLEQLRAVSEDLADAEEGSRELDVRDGLLQSSMTRVSEELALQLDQAKEHCRAASKRQEVLQGSAGTSRVVGEQLVARAAAAAEALDLSEELVGQERLVSATCLTSNRARVCEFQELLAGWHEAVWGPEAGLLPRDPERVLVLRGVHLQALGQIEGAVQEAEQVAGAYGGGLWGLSATSCDDERSAAAKQMGEAVKRYKEMRQQVKENLERLDLLARVSSSMN